MRRFKCMKCGTKQKIKDEQTKVSFRGNAAVIWGRCVKCRTYTEVVGSDDSRY